jgi:hypothetical protein
MFRTELDAAIDEALERLSVNREAMEDWERFFLVRLRQHGCHSVKHRQMLAKMVNRYVRDSLLSAEILGQQRLFL